MSAWLLLVSLLASDPRPPGDGDRALDHHRWSSGRKLLQMTPRGLETLHQCARIRWKCVCAVLRHRLRTSPFYWTHRAHDDRRHIPALVVSPLHGKGKGVPVFLLRSDAPPALHAISETGRIATDIIKGRPDSWTLHHHTAASGHGVQAFLLENTESRAPDAIFLTGKMLTKRNRAATAVIIPCCFKAGEMRSATNVEKMSKEQLARAQRRREESARRPGDIKVHMKYDRKDVVRQRDVSQAAALHSASSAIKSSKTISQLEIQRNSARSMKRNEHLNLNLLLKRTQLPLKAASSASNDDDDGLFVERRLLLASREKTGSIHRPQFKLKPTQDANKVDFNEMITQRAEWRRQEGGRESERSQTNTNANGNRRRLAYILQAYFTHETDNNDVDTKQVLTEAGEDVLIMLFLPDTDRETQTGPSSGLNTGWETIKTPTKVLYDPTRMTKVIKECFIIEPESLKERLFSLEMHVPGRTERIDIKPAERRAEGTTASDSTEGRVKETQRGTAHTETNNLPGENMGINQTKQKENVTSEESVIPSPPSLKMTERETVKTETTTVNTEMKETTSSTEVVNRGGTHKADRPPSTETPGTPGTETGAEPRCVRCKTGSGEVPVEKSFSGLRMREDVPARALTDGEAAQKDAKVNSVRFAKPFPTVQEQAEDTLPNTAGDRPPLCRGLIHRTEAGRRHCAERAAGTGSKMFSSGALKHTGEQESIRDQDHNLLIHDHFYYFDGVLRRVRNNLLPLLQETQKHRK